MFFKVDAGATGAVEQEKLGSFSRRSYDRMTSEDDSSARTIYLPDRIFNFSKNSIGEMLLKPFYKELSAFSSFWTHQARYTSCESTGDTMITRPGDILPGFDVAPPTRRW